MHGIYWIGEAPQILFVAKKNYGWENAAEFEEQATLYMPLEFAFHNGSSMSGYWDRFRLIVR